MRLLFVEFPEHVDEARRLAMGGEIIALTPHAAADLEACGTAYRFPEDVFPWRQLEDAGIGFLEQLKRLIENIDRLFIRETPRLRQIAFTPARFSTFELLVICGSIWTKLYRVARVVEALQPSHVTYFGTPETRCDDPIDFDQGSLYAEVIARVCRDRGIASERIEKPMPVPCRWKSTGGDPPLPQRSPTLAERLFGRLARGGMRIFRRGARPRVLAIQSPLPIADLGRYVDVVTSWDGESRPAPFDRAEDSRDDLPAAEIEAAWQALCDDAQVRAFFQFEGRDWFALAEQRLRRFVIHQVPRGFRAFVWGDAMIGRHSPQATLFTNIYKIELHAIAHAARRHGVPVICEPHGPYGHFVNYVCPLFDATTATDYLIGGPGVQRYHRSYYSLQMRECCTGASMMDRARMHAVDRAAGLHALGLDPAKPVVMFVIQNVNWNREYTPYSQRDDRRTWRIEKKIIDVLARHADIQVILKGHPGASSPTPPLRSYSETMLGERFRFVASWPFIDMLDMADVFVLGYAVTTIFQALTRKRRVYAINDFYPVVPFHRSLLEGATYYAEDVDGFCAMLDADLASGQAFRPSAKDHQAFLRELADPGGEGTPSDRIAGAIRDIAVGHDGEDHAA